MPAGVPEEGLFEELPAAVEPGHHGPDRAVQDLRDLLVREVLQIGQDDDHPVVVRQRLQRLADVVVQNPGEELGLGVGGLLRVVAPDDALERVLDLGKVDAARLELLLPVVVDERVLQDLEEPRLQVGPLLEFVVVLVCLEEGLLDQVLGVLGAPGHPVGRVVERVHVRHDLGIEVPGRDRRGRISFESWSHAYFLHTFRGRKFLARPAASPSGRPDRANLRRSYGIDTRPVGAVPPTNTGKWNSRFPERAPCPPAGTGVSPRERPGTPFPRARSSLDALDEKGDQ